MKKHKNKIKSEGRSRAAKERFTTHGAKVDGKVLRSYRSWQMMKNRCLNPNAADYKYYGGRGITVCAEWMKYETFLADMGEPGEGLSLDRIDNNLGYSKANCRWATKQEQSRNRDYCKRISFEGESYFRYEWPAILGLTQAGFDHRMWRHNSDPEKYPFELVFRRKKGSLGAHTTKKPYTVSPLVVERVQTARKLRASGMSLRAIGNELGVSFAAVRLYLKWSGVGPLSKKVK